LSLNSLKMHAGWLGFDDATCEIDNPSARSIHKALALQFNKKPQGAAEGAGALDYKSSSY